jgi:hypothetical protein
MKFAAAFAGLVCLVSLSGVAHGDEAWSGALFDKRQKEASCTVLSLRSCSVKSVRIVSSDGSPVSVPFENCGGLIPDGKICNVNANLLSPSLMYFCQVDAGGASTARCRGTFMIYDSSLQILGTSDVRPMP